MKILHVTFSFPPDPPAGTELYVDALCRELGALGIESVVTAPARHSEGYECDGLRVRRFAMSPRPCSLADLYGGSDLDAAAVFERILDEECPDLLHQHALTHACSIELMKTAKQRGIPVVFTYHTPATTCQRGTLLERGTTVCDGRVTVERCTPCTLHGLGLNQPLSRLVAQTPARIGTWLNDRGVNGGVLTALQMPSLIGRRLDLLSTFLNLPDRFVALAPWVRDLLRVNGVADERIVMSRHGLRNDVGAPARASRARDGPLRIAHLGRLDPVKGTYLLIRAVRAIPTASVTLDVFGILQGPADSERLDRLRALASADRRIRFLAPLAPGQVIDTLAGYDLVAVPSQWLETGPLVVLEAQAAGVPVIGSALGGIADKVADGVDGLLVSQYASVQAWSAAVDRCARQPDLVAALGRGVCAPRSMTDVANEMSELYAELTSAAEQAYSRAG